MNYGLVSIIMPSYNTELYIANSIRSVISQTYKNWELIIIDDCSSDGTIDIIKSFNDKRIKLLVNKKNSGAAISRNRGLKEACGKFIAFLDSDDMWNKNKLKIQLQFMKKYDYHFTYSDYRIQKNGIWLPYICTGPLKVNLRKLYNYCYFFTSTVIYEREYVGLIQIEDLKKNNDYAMWFQALRNVDAYRLPRCLSYYVKHEESISSGHKWKLIKWHYILYRKGLQKGPWISSMLTFNNLVHGIVKKVRYWRAVNEAQYGDIM